MRLSEDPAKLASVRDNVFPVAREVVSDWDAFPWHRNTQTGDIDADVLWSSQALCMSVWGTVAAAEGAEVRAMVGRAMGATDLARALAGGTPRIELEMIDGGLLNEKGSGNLTNLDVIMEVGSLVVVVESKLSEPLGGCSQPPKHCSATYGPGSDLKYRTPAPCRLAIPDGRRTARDYWTVMDAMAGGPFAPMGVPCPFRGPGYQVMRTIASAFRLGQVRRRDWRVVFAFPFSLGGTTPSDVAAIRDRLLPEHRARVGLLDYDALAGTLRSGESAVARDLGRHMAARIAAARVK